MLSLQHHRGPDAAGAEVDDIGLTWLGHTRLAVMDLRPVGDQPVANEDRSVLAVVNGEIYNAPVLRQRLEARGHRFRSRSDSEVIVHLYEEYGHAVLDHLDGMFAFVLHDTATGDVLCARDRMGKKPLLYAETDDGVAVASELPALLTVPGVDRTYDDVGLAVYLLRNFRHLPEPFTLYRGIRKLEPGHAMLLRRGRVIARWRYADVRFETAEAVSPGAILEAFDRAVESRLMSDVEIGALLSGGVDSTAIVDAMSRLGHEQVRTYALGRDRDDTELQRARRASTILGTRHVEVYFEPKDALARYVRLQRIHGEPVALLPLVMANVLFDHVRDDGLKVVMTGHGADESFYGYSGFLRLAQLSDWLRYLPRRLRPAAALVAGALPPGAAREAALVASLAPGSRKAGLYADEARRRLPGLVHTEPADVAHAVARLFGTWFSSQPPADYIDEAAAIGLMHENSHSVTIAADLPAMAESVEVRAPFLDAELLALSRVIPYRQKVGGSDRELKHILKQALASRLPHDLLYARKQGFGFNLQEADILGGPWSGHVEGALRDLGDLDGVLRPGAAERTWTSFRRTRDSYSTITTAKLYALALSVGAGT